MCCYQILEAHGTGSISHRRVDELTGWDLDKHQAQGGDPAGYLGNYCKFYPEVVYSMGRNKNALLRAEVCLNYRMQGTTRYDDGLLRIISTNTQLLHAAFC